MLDWQMKEYDELRHQVLWIEYGKYLESRVRVLVEKLHCEAYDIGDKRFWHPDWSDSAIETVAYWVISEEGIISGEIRNWAGGYEEFSFPALALTLKEEDAIRYVRHFVYDRIEELEKKRAFIEIKHKEREIKELEKALAKLKGQS